MEAGVKVAAVEIVVEEGMEDEIVTTIVAEVEMIVVAVEMMIIVEAVGMDETTTGLDLEAVDEEGDLQATNPWKDHLLGMDAAPGTGPSLSTNSGGKRGGRTQNLQ